MPKHNEQPEKNLNDELRQLDPDAAARVLYELTITRDQLRIEGNHAANQRNLDITNQAQRYFEMLIKKVAEPRKDSDKLQARKKQNIRRKANAKKATAKHPTSTTGEKATDDRDYPELQQEGII